MNSSTPATASADAIGMQQNNYSNSSNSNSNNNNNNNSNNNSNSNKLMRVLMFTLTISMMTGIMFNIALPKISEQFSLSLSQVSWLSSAYILIYAIGAVTYGKLADRYTLKSIVTFGLLLFAAGSLLGLASQTFAMALIGRCLQAAGAAVIPAIAMIIPLRYCARHDSRWPSLRQRAWSCSSGFDHQHRPLAVAVRCAATGSCGTPFVPQIFA